MTSRANHVNLTPAETRRFLRQKNSRSVYLWAFTVIALLAIVALSAYGYYLRHDFAVVKAWVPFLGCIVLWWIHMLAFVPWYATWRHKRHAEHRRRN